MKKLSFLFAALAAGVSFVGTGAVLTPTNYSKMIEISVSGYAGTETLQDFPVLVKLSESIVDFDYGDFKLANGGDLRFALEDGTILPSEIDTWDETGTSLVWVKVPALEKDAKIFVYYGNETPEEVSAADVWNDGYAAVYHLGESALPMKESGARATDFTASEGNGIVFAADGAIGKGVNFVATGTTRGLKALDHDKLDGFAAMTVEIWTYQATHATVAIVDKRAGYDNDTAWQMYDGNGPTTFGICSTPTGKGAVNVNIINPPLNAWNYQVYTYDSTLSSARTKGYLNGAYVNSNNSQSGAVRASAAPLWLGIFQSGDNRNFPGKVDELRISNVARSADWIKAGYDTVSADGFLTYGRVKDMDETAVVFDGLPTVEKNGASFTMFVRLSEESGTAKLSAVYGSDDPSENNVVFEPVAVAGNAYQYAFENLAVDSSYSFAVWGESNKGVFTRRSGSEAFYTGCLSVAKAQDADEKKMSDPGVVVVSRADTNGILNVRYTVAGTAEPGTHYEPLSGSVTIPNGASYATIEIWPIRAKDKDTTVEITLTDGLYSLDDEAKSATVNISKLVTPSGWNTWVAAEPGKASDAANWSEGRAPTETDNILFDADYSSVKCTWDAEATHTVASWRQMNGYTALVEFETEFPTYSGAAFPLFVVSGDCEILSGGWTHRGNYSNYGAAKESNTSKLSSKHWCLNAQIGGDLTVASGASINVTGKGFGHPGNQSAPCYGGYCYNKDQSCAPYGSITEPFDPGMGCRSQGDQNGNRSGIGGGAVKLAVVGDVIVDGSISALGNIDLNVARSGGTGGSIWIDAKQISGAGKIDASACPPSYYTSDQSVAVGSGGRIALYTKSALAISRDNLVCNGSAYQGTGGSKTKVGSCGTIFIKDPAMTNGALLLKQDSSIITVNSANSAVPLIDDLTLDEIEFRGRAVLAVETGKTLTLPGGFASVTSDSTTIGANGISYRGGVINSGTGNQTISGWMLEPVSNFNFAADVALSNYGAIGIIKRNICGTGDAPIPPRKVAFTVAGDMSVDATSAVDVGNVVGYSNYGSGQRAGWYGGWTTYYDKNGNQTGAHENTYGSVFDPQDFGSSPTRSFLAGGAINMAVIGNLDLEGRVTASGLSSDNTSDGVAPSSGGSVKMSIGSLTGTGSITACAGAGRYAYAGGGAGGRIAIKLTDAKAAIPDTIVVNAGGSYGYAFNAKATKLGSAGTVYIETAADGAKGGTITISNWKDHSTSEFTSATVFPTTPIVAYVNGDAVADFKNVALAVANNAIAEVSAESLKMKSLEVASGSKLDLNGKTLTVNAAKLGGAKLKVGTYTASDYPDFLTGEGSLVVKGTGMMLLVR